MNEMARNIPQTEEDFLNAQQEAIRRVREMQARARQTLESAGMRLEPPSQPGVPPVFEYPAQSPVEARTQANRTAAPPLVQNRRESVRETAEHRQQPPNDGGLHIPLISDIVSGNFPKLPVELLNISLDNEQIIILMLLYVLYIDKADPYLMIALAYVLL
jgi:hypothetical protein